MSAGWCATLLLAVVATADEIRPGPAVRLAAASVERHVEPPPSGDSRIRIDVEAAQIQQLHEAREHALQGRALPEGNDGSVRAALSWAGESHPVELRLLGEPEAGLAGDAWPLGVKMKSGSFLRGMRRFGLIRASSGGPEDHLLPLAHLRRLEILAPQAALVELSLNGEPQGAYLLREANAKELIESQQRRDGVILRAGDSRYWSQYASNAGLDPTAGYLASDGWFDRRVKEPRSETRPRQVDVAVGLLRGFLEGRIAARDVFDLELMARYLAVAELWQSRSATSWQHLRFYLNPTTHRIEPVASRFDERATDEGPGLVSSGSPIARVLLGDPDLRSRFVAAAHDVAEDVLAGDLFSQLSAVAGPELARRQPLKASPAFDFDRLRRRARQLRALHDTDVAVAATPPRRAAAGGKGYESPLAAQEIADILARNDFLRFDASGNRLVAKPGQWTIDGSLLLPAGTGLYLPAGTQLHFAAGEGLVATGPLDFAGTATRPVVIAGVPGGAPQASWAGIAVLESTAPSRWTHVHVKNTTGFDRAGWAPTGAVLFRKAPVTLEHCRFEGSRAEDTLNVVRTTFALRDVAMTGTRSDAFDADFSRGTVIGGSFTDVGGDGIDVSGSEVEVEGTRFGSIHDKAVSVGEASRLIARGLRIRDVGTAFVSKDRSHAELRDSDVSDVAHIALMAYVKKPRFGPAELVAAGNKIENATQLALAQRDSVVVIDGQRIAGQDIRIDQLYESGYMRK